MNIIFIFLVIYIYNFTDIINHNTIYNKGTLQNIHLNFNSSDIPKPVCDLKCRATPHLFAEEQAKV